MKEKLEAILKVLEDAHQQVAEVKLNDAEWEQSLDEIEMGIESVKRKLEDLKAKKSGQN